MNPDQDSRTAGCDVLAKVAAALAACDGLERQASALPKGTAEEHAERSARLALVCARRAGWWRVLERFAYRLDSGVHSVHGQAAMLARVGQQDRARFWRDSARDWRVRAERGQGSAGAWAMWGDGVTGVAS